MLLIHVFMPLFSLIFNIFKSLSYSPYSKMNTKKYVAIEIKEVLTFTRQSVLRQCQENLELLK